MNKDDSRRCIICENIKNVKEFNKEHIIPEALGNKKLYLYNVCKDCNSKLGTKVDNYLTDCFPALLVRKEYNLVSQNGTNPNPFKQGKDIKGRIVTTDKDLKPTVGSLVKEEDGHLIVEASTIKEATKIIEKKLSRRGFSGDEIAQMIENADHKSEIFQPEMKMDIKIDLERIEIAFIKMAYEYAMLKLGEAYWNDDQAKRMRILLQNANKGIYNNTDNIIMKMTDELFNEYKLCIPDGTHAVFICKDCESRLIFNVILFKEEFFTRSVCLSFKGEKYDTESINPELIQIK